MRFLRLSTIKTGFTLFLGVYITLLDSASAFQTNIEGIQTYSKNESEHQQHIQEDLNRYYNADNLWDVLRSDFSLSHEEDNPAVQHQIQVLLSDRDFLVHSAIRAAPYLYYISQQVKKRHLPMEFVLLPIIESAYNPFDTSSAGARGLWQMMPDTASGFGLKQNFWYDGRRDLIASTKAALNYLTYLGGFFDNNWLLATAAYDTGEGNILSAIRKNIRDGQPTDFWSLPLSRETKAYVPRLLALAIIVSHPERYHLQLPPIRNAPYLAVIDVGKQINLKYAADLAGLTLKEVKQLNPEYNHIAMDPKGPYKLILPIENVEQFTENFKQSPSYAQSTQWIRYQVQSGDTLQTIAKKFNTDTGTLSDINSLHQKHLKPGMRLFVLRTRSNATHSEDASSITQTDNLKTAQNSVTEPAAITTKNQNISSVENKASTAMQNTAPLQPGDTIYIIRKKDTIEKIAKHFKVPVHSLLVANHLHSQDAILSVGNPLTIPTHQTASQPQQYHVYPGDTIYIVRHGDTLEKIAKKFHTTPPAIRVSNLLASNNVDEGDRLVIPTHHTG